VFTLIVPVLPMGTFFGRPDGRPVLRESNVFLFNYVIDKPWEEWST